MGWAIAIGLGVLTFAALIYGLKLPRGGREFAGAALLLGLAGYAMQGSPGQAGSPTAARETKRGAEAALIEARREMGDRYGQGRDYLITADAFARAGQFAAAATLLRGAVRQRGDDADIWLALGNALVGHAGGIITPAALYAYQKAADAAPDHPGPPFFTGLALAQSGQFEDARAIWQALMDRPGDPQAPWRADLAARIAQLDAVIAMQNGGPAGGQTGGSAMPSGPVPVDQGADGAAADRPVP